MPGDALAHPPLYAPRERFAAPPATAVPEYLERHYWWAYVRPNAVRVFERPWLVDLILWGNYRRLCDAALTALGRLDGRTLQIACVYGDLTPRMTARLADDHGTLDVVDILPVQLDNLRAKLPADAPVRLQRQDSTALTAADGTYDRVLMFFLMHEQPDDVRSRTIAESLRVLKPGGEVVIVDFAKPAWWHPLRYLWLPFLNLIEPFAARLWRDGAPTWLDAPIATRQTFFGRMFQLITLKK